MTQGLYTGLYGIVLLPDQATTEAAVAIAKGLGKQALDIGGKHQPHVTLYHAYLKNAPEVTVYNLMSEVCIMLPAKATFAGVGEYAQKFAFWDIVPTSELRALHERALAGLSKYLVRDSGAVGTETLKLSAAERENIQRFGHPLVKGLWRPHITVGYNEGGFDPTCFEQGAETETVFRNVAFVEIGEYGTIKKLRSVSENTMLDWVK